MERAPFESLATSHHPCSAALHEHPSRAVQPLVTHARSRCIVDLSSRPAFASIDFWQTLRWVHSARFLDRIVFVAKVFHALCSHEMGTRGVGSFVFGRNAVNFRSRMS